MVLKYWRHRFGNLRSSADIRGMMMLRPNKQTSAAVTVSVVSELDSGGARSMKSWWKITWLSDLETDKVPSRVSLWGAPWEGEGPCTAPPRPPCPRSSFQPDSERRSGLMLRNSHNITCSRPQWSNREFSLRSHSKAPKQALQWHCNDDTELRDGPMKQDFAWTTQTPRIINVEQRRIEYFYWPGAL